MDLLGSLSAVLQAEPNVKNKQSGFFYSPLQESSSPLIGNCIPARGSLQEAETIQLFPRAMIPYANSKAEQSAITLSF